MSLKDKSKDEQFEIWRKRTKIAKELHKERVVEWAEKVFKEYCGDNNYDSDTNEKYEQIAQIVMAVEETVQPHLFFNNPEFYAKAKEFKSAWERRESFVSSLVNHEYTDIKDGGRKIELENELVVLDARLLPFGVTKTEYEVDGEIIREKKDPVQGFITGEQEFNETPVITKERCIVERKNPLKVLLDYGAEHITKQRFTIEIIDCSKDDLESERYDQSVVSKMEPSVTLLPQIRTYEKEDFKKIEQDSEFKGFRIYEIHDLENRVIHTIADGVDEFLEKDSPYPLDEGSQYSFLYFIDSPNQVYPHPPIKFYRKRASEFSYIYSQVSKQIDKFLPKILYDLNAIPKDEQTKLKNGGVGTLVGVQGNPLMAYGVFAPPIQTDLFKYLGMIKELLNMESSVNEYELGDPEKRKATEAQQIQQGTTARRFKPQKRVKDFLISQSHTIFLTLKKNMTLEHLIKVLGDEDAQEWWNDPSTGKQSWTNENNAGDYSFTYDVESVSPQDSLARQKNNVIALETTKDPNLRLLMAQEGKKIKIAPIFERFLKDNLKINDISRIMEDMNYLTPEQEHDQWMNGEFPPITKEEANNPEFVQEHIMKHQAWLKSPGAQMLHEYIKMGANEHIVSYGPLVKKMAQEADQSSNQGASKGVNIDMTTKAPSPLAPVESEGMVSG